MSARPRVLQQAGYVLHSKPWRETSLIVDIFSRDHGRVAVVAKGARRPLSILRGVLMGFQPLRLDWSGSSDLKTLIRADWQGGQPCLAGPALLCGYYLNELLLRLCAREDPHPHIFDAYVAALQALAAPGAELATILRRFELALLREIGFGVELATLAGTSEPVKATADYVYIIEHGVRAAAGDTAVPDDALRLHGQSLLDMDADDFSRPRTRQEAKGLLRILINHTLQGQPLHSRRVLMELQEL